MWALRIVVQLVSSSVRWAPVPGSVPLHVPTPVPPFTLASVIVAPLGAGRFTVVFDDAAFPLLTMVAVYLTELLTVT